MDYISNLQDMYNKMLASRQTDILKKKQADLTDLESQQGALGNQYADVVNNLKTKQTQAKQGFYNDRNTTALGNAQRVQSIRDYMAKNNLMASNENADAMMRVNTDLGNAMGNIYNQEKQTDNYYGSQIDSTEREKAQKIADIMNRMRLVNEGANSDISSAQNEIEAKKLADINNYNLQQEQYQRQLAAQQAKASSSTTSTKAQKEQDGNAVWNELHNQLDNKNGENFLYANREAIIQNLGASEYNKMLDYVKSYSYDMQENKRYAGRMNNSRPNNYEE